MAGGTDTSTPDGVVVGHDGSHRCDTVVVRAAGLARRLGLPLHVVRVWSLATAPRPASMTTTYVPPLAEFEQAVVAALTDQVGVLDLGPDAEVHLHALKGQAAERLVAFAAEAEMLVIGARGAGGFPGLSVGSTVSQVVRHCPVPVLVVPTATS